MRSPPATQDRVFASTRLWKLDPGRYELEVWWDEKFNRDEPNEALLEASRLERAGEGVFDDEHDAVAALAQHRSHADAVIGRPECPLGEKRDRCHGQRSIAAPDWRRNIPFVTQ